MENRSTLKTLNDRENYGRNVALVMALKPDENPPNAGPALPNEASTIRDRLQALSQKMTSNHADPAFKPVGNTYA